MALVLAHRGANRVEPENTLAAFERAFELGADGVELDVHRTADGGLVVHHDAVAPGVGLLAETPTDVIRRAAPTIPTLAEALDACAGRFVNVEIKHLPGDADPAGTAAAAVAELLVARGHRDQVLVSSFDLATVDRVRALDPTPVVPTALLTARATGVGDVLALAHDHGHAALNPRAHALVGRRADRLVERAHDLGMSLYVWTVNDARQLRRLAVAGVTGLITDVPDRARRALAT